MILHIWVAFLIDLLLGDPSWLPHPVVYIGKAIDLFEVVLRRWLAPIAGEKAAGVVLLLLIVGGTFGVASLIIELAGRIHTYLAVIIEVYILYASFALKGLYEVARKVFGYLIKGDIAAAREKVGWLVGRDTANMEEADITRATVESVAENFIDGILSPLFYAFLGGAPLALAYKAVNTLDSMVGYKNDKYLNFGWASARFDDLANFVPARIGGYLLLMVAFLRRKNFRKAYAVMLRDADKHPSPNGGIPEAVVSGALGIRLGGFNYYGGVKSFRAYLGDPLYPLEPKKILESTEMMLLAAFLGLIIGTGAYISLEKIVLAVLEQFNHVVV